MGMTRLQKSLDRRQVNHTNGLFGSGKAKSIHAGKKRMTMMSIPLTDKN